jgi:peptide/nickel transport system substrate-binding protein
VREILTPDQRTVQINLTLPYAPLLTVLAHPVFSVAHSGTGAMGWIGTGPYSVSEASPGRLTLDANPSYWATAPRSARVILLDAGDPAKAESDLDSRGLDLLVPAGAPSRMQGTVHAGLADRLPGLQTRKEPFKRKKVRQVSPPSARGDQHVDQPLAAALGHFLPRGVWAWTGTPPLALGDVAAARRLLGEAGVGQGLAASLVLDATAGPEVARVADVIREALGAASIAVSVRADAPDAALEAMQSGANDLALAEARAEAGDPHFLLYPLSTSEGAVRGPTATNFSFYGNARLDDLLIRASQISFRQERQRVYGRTQVFLAEEVPWIPLYVRLHWAVARPEVRSFRLHPSGNHRLDRAWVDAAPQPPPPAPRTP